MQLVGGIAGTRLFSVRSEGHALRRRLSRGSLLVKTYRCCVPTCDHLYRRSADKTADDGELQKAEEHYGAAAKIDPEDPAPQFNLGVLMEDCKRPQQALRAYREAIELDPSFADAHYNLALLFESMGKKAEAVAHFHAARKIYLSK